MILKKICYNSWIIPFEQNHRKRKETSEHWTCNNKEKKYYLLSEPNDRATKILSKNLLAIEMKKKKTTNIHTQACVFRLISIRIM